MVKLLLKIILFLTASHYIFCEEVNVNLSCDNNNVIIGEIFQINLNITGNTNDIEIKDINKSDASIIIRESGKMSSVSIVNGVMNSSLIIAFLVNISKSGSYEIGPVILNIKGNEYKSNIININVTESSNLNQTNYNENDNSNNKNYAGDNFFLLESNTSKNKVYASEFIDVACYFYQRANIQKNYNYKPLNFPDNAWIEGIEDLKSNTKQIIKNNFKYQENEMEHKRIFISKPGIYTINPATMNLTGIIPIDFFASDEKQFSLTTKPITIEVVSLPEDSPKGFDGAVGVFKMHTSINPIKINGKNPTSLKIFLEGEGNFHNLKDIGFSADNSFEVFSSKSNTESNDKKNKTKILEVLLIPSKSGNFKIKTNNFIYFDIIKKQYITLKGSEYNIAVTNIDAVENQSSNSNSSNNSLNKINSNVAIGYIKTDFGINNSFFLINTWFFILILLYVLIILAVSFIILYKYVLINVLNCDSYLKKKAYKYFNKNISSLHNDCKNKNSVDCIDKISMIIEKYFIDKFKIDSVEFTNKSIQEKLHKYLCNDNISKLKEIISELDIIRFGGHNITDSDIFDLLNKIKLYIKNIEIETSKSNKKVNK